MTGPPLKRALLSVSDKTGVADFAQALSKSGVELYSTGGTRRHLEEAGLPVIDIADYTGFPEMMDGRLKTLHPKVHGGILCRHDRADDMQALAQHEILSFELVVVNLYPFQATLEKLTVSHGPIADWPAEAFDQAVEQIDIGGPTMVRAAAKNHAFTTIATSTSQYPAILEQLAASGGTTVELRRELAGAAFAMTATYDRAINDFFSQADSEGPFAAVRAEPLQRQTVLRYGENPHQQAALYVDATAQGANLVSARQLNGKELSYNNLLDLDAALAMARMLDEPSCVVLKHNNPCGAAAGDTLAEATLNAFAGDPVSAFGSIIGYNRPVDAAAAEVLVEPGKFVEAIVAPSFEPQALEILTTKPKWKKNVRLLEVGDFGPPSGSLVVRQIEGGLLVQQADIEPDDREQWKVVTKSQPTDAQLADLAFTWAMVRHVKSNAIVLGKLRALWGVGAGQMSRVDSVEIAIKKAAERAAGCVLASDAFFPFPDSIHAAAAAGVTAIIQPGGSMRDDEVIAACDELGLPMIFTGRRHFKH